MAKEIIITLASLLFLGNKTLLLLGKKTNKMLGWSFGAVGAALFIVYFFMIHTPILSVLEIGLTILMTYRFIAGEKTNRKIENYLGIITGLFIVVLTILARQGTLSLPQFAGAFGMLVGTYFLISVKQELLSVSLWRERMGWLLYGSGHFFTSYIGYQKHEWIFFTFQAWQMLLCLIGFAIPDLKDRKLVTSAGFLFCLNSALIFFMVIKGHY